jgi:hypothetical protein
MAVFSESAHTAFRVDRNEALPVGANPFVFGLRNANRMSLQWIVHQAVVGASATIDLYVAATDRDADDLANLDPTTNPYWSPLEDVLGVPLTFPHLPGAVIGSCLLPIGLLSISALLVVVTVAGNPYPLGSFSLLARITG